MDKYLAYLDIPNGGKSTRRDSSSLVDEFFGDSKDTPELSAAKKMISAGLSRSTDISLLRTGLLNATKQQLISSACSETSRRTSSSLVDEFFVTECGDKTLTSEAKSHSHVPSLQSTRFQNGFDMDATYVSYDNAVVPRSSTQSSTNSSQQSVSMWDNIRACINITDDDRDSDIEMEESSVPIIKSEDSSDKPSCLFQGSSNYDNVHIKQEHPSSCMLNDSSSSDFLDRSKSLSIPVPQSVVMPSTGSPVIQYVSQYSSGGIVKSQSSPSQSYSSMSTPPHTVPCLMPPTPPGSQPGSPSNGLDMRRTPPPPYPGLMPSRVLLGGSMLSMSPVLSVPQPGHLGSPSRPQSKKPQKTHPGCSTIKYNRKNNPDLEKRRIHFCDFPGKLNLTFFYRFFVRILTHFLANLNCKQLSQHISVFNWHWIASLSRI